MKKPKQDGPGSLDPAFGENGILTLPAFGDPERFVTDMQLHGGGMLVSAMGSDDLKALYAMALFQESGELDRNFGAGGVAFGAFRSGIASGTEAIAIAPDSNLWIVGWLQSDDKPHTPLLARFLKNGTLDKTFNPPHGYQSLDMPGENDLVMHASTLHVGNHHVLVSANSQALWGPNHARVYRLGLAGEPGFGLRKWIEITHGTDEVFVASVIQQNRAFLVAGTLVASTLKAGQKQSRGFIARFHDDGTPDLSFGEQDAFRVYASPFIDHNIAFNHLLQRPDGRLTAVGTLPNARPRDTHAMVWQFKGDGTIDASFNNGNPAVVTFNKYSNDEWLTATLHADGKLVVAGHASRWGLHLARYRTDGSLDNAFGENGVVHLDRMSARSMTLRPLSPTATLLAYNGLGPGGHLGLLAKFRN